MTNLADNAIALRRYEREQADSERVSESCEKRAERDVCDAAELADAIAFYDVGHDVASCLARCFRELDGACRGGLISQVAITTALHNLKRDLIERRAKTLYSEWEPE